MTERINISIPSFLRKEMKKHDVNWSAVCAQAIQQHIQNIQKTQQPEKLDKLEQRLKKIELFLDIKP